MPLSTHRTATHIWQAGAFVLLVSASIVALWPVQRDIGRHLQQLKHEVVQRIEQATGRRITYQSISPSIFRFLEIRGLEVYDPGTNQEPLLRIRRIEVSYSIWKLLTGDPAGALNTISIENSTLHINTRSDADVIRFFQDLTKGGGAAAGLPAVGSIKLAGKNLSLSVTSPKGTFRVDRLFFQLENTGEALRVQIRGGVSLALNNGPLGLTRAETAVRITGTVDRQLAWSDLRVRFDNLASNLFNMARPTFHLTLRSGLWQLRKIQDNAPVDLQASYDQSSELISLSFVADKFRPEDYFTFGKKLEQYAPWLSSLLSGTGSIKYSMKTQALSYDASLQVGIANRLVPFPVQVSTDVAGNRRLATFSRLLVNSRYGDIRFSGDLDLTDFLPDGTLAASNVYTPLGARLSADFTIDRKNSSVQAEAPTLVMGKTILHGVAITVSPSRSTVDFTMRASFDQHESQLRSDGTVYLSQTPYLTLALSTHGVPLDRLYSLLDPQPLPSVLDTLKGLTMTSKVYVTTNLKQFSFASPEVTISDSRPAPKRQMSFRISGNDRSLRLQNLVVDWRQYHVSGSVDAAYVENNRVELTSTAKVENQSYSVHGFYQVGDSLILTGSYGIDLAAVKQGDRYVFTLRTEKLPIPFAHVTTEATLDLEGVYANPDSWEVVSRNTSMQNLPFLATGSNSMTVSARLSSAGGDIYSLTYADQASKLAGNGKVTLNPTARGLSGNGWLQMTGSLPGESYSANFNFSPGDIAATVSFARSPLSRLGKFPVSGQVSGHVDLSGKLANPEIAVDLSLPEGQIYSDPITADISFTASNSQIQLESLSGRYLASSLSRASGRLDFKTGKFNLAGDYRGDVNGDLVAAHVAIAGELAPIERRSELSNALTKNLKAIANVSSITVQNSPAKPWSASIERKDGKVVFAGGPGSGVSGYLLDSGKFFVDLAAPLPVTLRAEGEINGSSVNASLQNVVLDLHAFDSVAKIPYFDISKGKARGNLQITGAINDPDFQGNLAATDVYGRTPVVPNEIGPFNTDLVFRGKSLSMSDVAIRSGNSQVLGNLDFTLDHWIPTSFDLKFVTQGTQGVHVKYSISGIDFDGYASGTTTITGQSGSTRVGGKLDISSCLITLGSAGQGGSSTNGGPNANNTVYDFTFITGKQVQFVWPNNTVPILRSYADTGQKLTITADGNTGDFNIVGNVNVKGGEVFYLRQNFYLRQGSIAFNEDQNKVDPIVNVRAELREVDAEGKNVSIYLVVNNKPLSQFAPSFESDPPMTNAEILAMLGQDIYAQLGGQQLNLTSAALFTGDLLSQFSILRTFEDKVKQAFSLDLFSVRTDLLQNLFREKVLGQAPPTTSSPASSLGRYLDNTTFFLGKYFGNDLFLEAMINLRSNNALLSQYGNTGNLQIDSQILFDWKTPLFLLQLSVQPDPTDLLTSLTKTSLSLSWGFSF